MFHYEERYFITKKMLKILLGKCVSKELKNTRNPANKWVLKVTAETLEKVKKYVESLIKTLERNQ